MMSANSSLAKTKIKKNNRRFSKVFGLIRETFTLFYLCFCPFKKGNLVDYQGNTADPGFGDSLYLSPLKPAIQSFNELAL